MMWAVTENGKQIPLDVEPVPTGNLILVGKGNVPMVHFLTADEQPEGDRYVSHFATCPQSKAWQKR